MAHVPNLTRYWLHSPQAKNSFYIFKWSGKKIKKLNIFHDLWKIYKIQIPLPINKVLLEKNNAHFFLCCCGFFHAAQQSGVVETETKWPAVLKVFTIWPFTEKVSWPGFYKSTWQRKCHCLSRHILLTRIDAAERLKYYECPITYFCSSTLNKSVTSLYWGSS